MAHLYILYQKNKINVYCGPSLIIVNPYKRIENEVNAQKMSLITTCYENRKLDLAPPHIWTIAA